MVEVELPLREPRRSLAVRREALIIRADGLHVYRVDAQQGAERLVVESGAADADWIALKSAGLKQGDQVVVRGGERLQVVGIYEDVPPVAGRDGSLSAALEPRPEPANGSVQGGLRGSAQSL